MFDCRTETIKVIIPFQFSLEEEDLGCLSVHYFRHEQAPELEPPTFISCIASSHESIHKFPSGIQTHSDEGASDLKSMTLMPWKLLASIELGLRTLGSRCRLEFYHIIDDKINVLTRIIISLPVSKKKSSY